MMVFASFLQRASSLPRGWLACVLDRSADVSSASARTHVDIGRDVRAAVAHLDAVLVTCGLLSFLLAGCGREQIRVYRVPKEKPAEVAQAGQGQGTPHLHFKTPEGWTELPAGGMRAARFSVAGKNDRALDVSAIPLPGMAASKQDIVNLWREQVHLPAVKEEELSTLMEEVLIGETKGELFDMLSSEPLIDQKLKARILVAMLKDGPTTWFFKMTGDDESVREQKPAFLAFLKSVTIDHTAQPPQQEGRFTSTNVKKVPSAGDDAAANPAAKPVWEVPPGWTEAPPTQMLLAKFLLPGQGANKAEVTVSVFPGTVGGILANVNRWRGQIGLPPTNESDLEAMTSSLDVPGGKAILVDMSGTDAKSGQKARLIGAILPQGERTWFYKLMGDEQIAEREKQAFVKFVQTAKHPNG
jgi:hypothetical protein